MEKYELKFVDDRAICYVKDKDTGKLLKKATRPLVKERVPAWAIINGDLYINGPHPIDIRVYADGLKDNNILGGYYGAYVKRIHEKVWKFVFTGEPPSY